MNNTSLLAVVAVVQGALLAGLLLLIVINRWVRTHRRTRLKPLHASLDDRLRRWAMRSDEDVAPVLEALGRLPRLAAIDALVRWASRVPGERWAALAAGVAGARWGRAVRANARSGRWWKRLETARLLGAAPVPGDRPRLLRLLRDPHPAVHVAAISSIDRLQTPEMVAVALERLPLLTPTVQAYYINTLQRARGLVVERLLERLQHTTDPDLGRYAEFAARLEEPALRKPLTALADHPGAEVRVQVARALGAFPHPESIATLTRLGSDPAWEARAQAVRSLGRIGDPSSLALLRQRLDDEEWWVRQRAALALHRLGAAGRNALLDAEVGAKPRARDMARLVLGLSPQALAEFAA